MEDTKPTTHTVKVLAARKAEAVGILKKLAAKANRYGSEKITFTVSPERLEEREFKDWDGEFRKARVAVHDIEVSGAAPTVGRYEFLAALEHTAAGNICRVVPGHDGVLEARFRAAECACEHCKTKRQRKDTYVVRNLDTGAQVQVGGNCLKDYLGQSPAAAIARCAFLQEFDNLRLDHSGAGFDWYQTLEWLLTATATSIRIDGWLSRGAADAMNAKTEGSSRPHQYSTSQKIAVLWSHSKDRDTVESRKRLLAKVTDADRELATKVIAWVRGGGLRGDSEYIHNLKIACAEDAVTEPRHVGLICSAIAAYNRQMEIETKRRAELESRRNSQHVGEVGERLAKIAAHLVGSRYLGRDDWGQDKRLLKFRTAEGNMLTWITTAEIEIEINRPVCISGRVKAHKEWQGLKETLLSRAKVVEVEEPVEKITEPC